MNVIFAGDARAAAAPSTSNTGRYVPPTSVVHHQPLMPATEAGCCDAGRLLYVSGGDSCATTASTVEGGFRVQHQGANSSSSKLSPSSLSAAAWTSGSDDPPSSCDIVRTVCCLAERRQRLCRLGVDRVLSDGRGAAGDTPAENSDEEDDEEGITTDLGCGGTWTNNSDARVSGHWTRFLRIYLLSSQDCGYRIFRMLWK